MINSDKPVLVALTIKSIERAPCFTFDGGSVQSVIFKGESLERAACFEITHLLDPSFIYICQILQQHGFTVAELPLDWRYGYRSSLAWQNLIIENALKRIGKQYLDRIGRQYQSTEGIAEVTEYDSEFAKQVLERINDRFPTPVHLHELKHSFENEPSDSKLLITLDGLKSEGFTEGTTAYSHTSAQKRLLAMASIKITREGRQHLSPIQSHSVVGTSTIIQGDQFNNYGHAGSIGPHSVGTINLQQQWTAIQNEVDLSALTDELEQLRKYLQQSASSSSDYQQLALLSEAEEHAKKRDGSKAMEVLSKVGKGALGVAKDIGTEIAAKVIARSMGLE